MNNYHDLLIEDCMTCRGPPPPGPVSNARGTQVVDMVQGLVDELERKQTQLRALNAEKRFHENANADLQDKYDRLDASCKDMSERYEESQGMEQELEELNELHEKLKEELEKSENIRNAVGRGYDVMLQDYNDLDKEKKELENEIRLLKRKLKDCDRPHWAEPITLLASDSPKKRARRQS